MSEVTTTEQQDLFKNPLKGKRTAKPKNSLFAPIYENTNGKLFEGDSIAWLKNLATRSVDLIFTDPPYNINKTDCDRWDNSEQYTDWSMQWISEAHRILKKEGTLYICGLSEILADLKHPSMKYFKYCRWLIWHYKNKATLGNDWGRSHESILHLRKTKRQTFNVDDVRISYNEHTLKYPSYPQTGTSLYDGYGKKKDPWVPHPLGAKPRDVLEVPIPCNDMEEKTKHPHQKPEELVRKFILASSNANDLVIDPFSGSGTTIVVAEQLKRRWAGCELEPNYNDLAMDRLDTIIHKPKSEWIKFDRENDKKRNSIR